jgi:putative transposase
MPNSFTQIHIQAIFAVKYRDAIISNSWKEDLHKYITGIVKTNRHKMLSINTMPDHLHMFFGLRPSQSLSDLMQQVKGDSSEWVNKKKFTLGKFQWQEGFGGFSYAKSQISVVCNYIQNQEKHHKKKTFLEEYEEFLKVFEIEYDKRYIFQPLE